MPPTNVTSRSNNIRTASPTVRRLLEIGYERGLSDAAMARLAKTSNNMVNYWKTGRSAPSVMAMEELANGLGMELTVVPRNRAKAIEQLLTDKGVTIAVLVNNPHNNSHED